MPHQARRVVMGWLNADMRPLDTTMGRQVMTTETFTDDSGEPLYYIVYLQPAGFVIVPADDLVQPIIGFADDGIYDCSPENPLATLVNADLKTRVTSVRDNLSSHWQARVPAASDAQSRWNHFVRLSETSTEGFSLMYMPSVTDLRVAPLVKSKWTQSDVCGNHCCNYYTPNNYYCGCLAVAMAQLMRYHQCPYEAIGVRNFEIKVRGSPQTASTRGGDGLGGAYNWSDMPLAPDCRITDIQRQAIGSLCYDAGISVNTEYDPNGSGADALAVKDALISTFKYSNVVRGYDNGRDIGTGSIAMINPNLDYEHPVILGLWREDTGHAVICDGYGYNASTLYHHLNMGWAGIDDAWYNLPDVNATYSYTSVSVCLYNIFTTGTGEIISGRVTDISGSPIAEVTVTAKSGDRVYTTTTNTKGIYALAKIPSAATYTVSAVRIGYLFGLRIVTTGRSRDRFRTSGNRWQVDFVGVVAPDLNGDGQVDARDFAIFASAWLTAPGNVGWNPDCDISNPADNTIDMLDLIILSDTWLAGVE